MVSGRKSGHWLCTPLHWNLSGDPEGQGVGAKNSKSTQRLPITDSTHPKPFLAVEGIATATLRAHLRLNVTKPSKCRPWGGPHDAPPADSASRGKVLTQRDEGAVVLQHHLPVQGSLRRVQAQPLVLAEEHGHVPECHRLLQREIRSCSPGTIPPKGGLSSHPVTMQGYEHL